MKALGMIIICFFTAFYTAQLYATADAQLPENEAEYNTATEDATSITAEEMQYMQWAKELWDSLDRQTGDITIANGIATLHVPEEFYFLDAKDAERVLTEVWGNPPSQSTLGMLFPASATPFDSDAWGVTVEYEQEGHVKDDDADAIDYGDLLQSMKKDTRAESEYRIEQGYEPIELVGWAAPPYYDKASHKLHWAQEIKFGEQDVNTLNYNIRVLGREGVLILNFIAGMDQLEQINAELDQVLAMAEFDEGSRYADFDPSVDKVAAYGLGALISGKILAKTGILAGLILFLKKFGVFIIAGIIAVVGKLFKRS